MCKRRLLDIDILGPTCQLSLGQERSGEIAPVRFCLIVFKTASQSSPVLFFLPWTFPSMTSQWSLHFMLLFIGHYKKLID